MQYHYLFSELDTYTEYALEFHKHLKQLFSLDQTRTILDISYTRLKTLIQKEKLATIKNARGLINISSIDIERLLLDESHKVPLLCPRVQNVAKGDLLTLPEIAGQLQIHKEIVRDLGVKGWLKIDKKKVDGHVKNVAPPEIIEEFSKKYFVHDCKDINENETMIVPINISYSRLRNEDNFLVDMAKKLLEDMGGNFKEELKIESNIILNSKITINILKPISTKEILKDLYEKNLPQEKIINQLRYEITHDFMDKIYESLTINFDHI